MFVKLAVSACVLAVAFAAYNGPLAGGVPASQFPAGVDPQACPNYPNCENPAVAINQAPIQQYNALPQQQYNQAPVPQYNPVPQQYNQAPVPQYNPVPQQYNPAGQQYNQAPVAKYSPSVQNALDRGEYIGDGDYHGEGLAESGAPGYQGQPQAYNAAPARAYNPAPAYNPGLSAGAQQHQLPAGVGHTAQIPAGVDARACPNYPFCS